MRPISKPFLVVIDTDPYFKTCARRGADCAGRITIEHAFMYAGRQMDELWAFLPLCWYHHLGAGLNKRFNQWLCLARLAVEEIAAIQRKYPNVGWMQLKLSLGRQFSLRMTK